MHRKSAYGAVIAALMGATVLTTPVPAQAASRDGVCESGEFCYYYNSNQQGSVSDFTGSLNNYGTNRDTWYVFKGPGSGHGQPVWNNAASVWNRTSVPVTVYYNSNYRGTSQVIPAGAAVNLSPDLKNDNASHKFGSAGAYSAPGTNPYGSATSQAPYATSRTQFVDDEIARLTGERQCSTSDYRSYQDPTSNHNTGNALDCTISNAIGYYPSAAQRDQGWQLANWLRQYASQLQVRYVIWDGKIWSAARNSEGWRSYWGAGNGVTLGHFDHVHISIQNPYGD